MVHMDLQGPAGVSNDHTSPVPSPVPPTVLEGTKIEINHLESQKVKIFTSCGV